MICSGIPKWLSPVKSPESRNSFKNLSLLHLGSLNRSSAQKSAMESLEGFLGKHYVGHSRQVFCDGPVLGDIADEQNMLCLRRVLLALLACYARFLTHGESDRNESIDWLHLLCIDCYNGMKRFYAKL